MPTINNRKKEPLSVEKMKETFRGSCGIEIREFCDGIALVSLFESPEKQWWVDARPLIRDGETVTRREISIRLNREIPDRQGFIGARAI